MERGQIVVLGTVVIPPQNSPQKKGTEYLTAHPTWRYIGPADVINFEWQIGRWGWAGFAGESDRQYGTFSQPVSTEMKEFTTNLPSLSLSPLSPSGDPYDCEIWFKNKFSDLRVIVENCVTILEEAPPPPTKPVVTDLFIVSPTKSQFIGGIISVAVMFGYVGPAVTGMLYAAIGNEGLFGFDEKWSSGWNTFPISEATFKQGRMASVVIPIGGGKPGTYDIYAKISAPGMADVFTPTYLDTVTITL